MNSRFRLFLPSLLAAIFLSSCQQRENMDWPIYGGSAAGDRYSELAQIDKSNVNRLTLAWRYDTGEGGLQTSPLVINGTLYAYSPAQVVIALDAATGQLKWKFDPSSFNQAVSRQPARGLTYWTDGKEQRLFASGGTYLYTLNPASGAPITTFGEGGRVDLRQGLGREPLSLAVFLTSPGLIYKDLIIVGFRTSETKPAAPGAVRAYDVRSGALRWTFHLIPRPGEPGHETWPAQAWRSAGGANAWAGFALDQKRGIVYVPTGSAVDDFYGGDRRGDNLYANSLLALDAATGKHRWHFQAVHHDVWDWDLPSAPVLLTVRRNGRTIDAVAQASKNGFLFLFDRQTGTPLFPIEERPVPQSDVPGEQTAPTQPFPLKPAPFARQRLTPQIVTTRTPQARAAALNDLDSFRNEGPFTPLTLGRQSVVFPSFDGGAEWGGAAVDRKNAIMYINAIDIVSLGGLARPTKSAARGEGADLYEKQCAVCHGLQREGAPPEFPRLTDVASRLASEQINVVIRSGRGRMPGFPQFRPSELHALITYLTNSSESLNGDKQEVQPPGGAVPSDYLFTGYRTWLDAEGFPAVAPPWGTLNAIDLNTGEYRWKVPLGEYPELAAKDTRNTGTRNYGGPLVTTTGLLFIGATIYDRKFRAFDADSGQVVWETDLPFAGNATPITYMVNGRQYIAIACSGARDPKGPRGSAYTAFALPDSAP